MNYVYGNIFRHVLGFGDVWSSRNRFSSRKRHDSGFKVKYDVLDFFKISTFIKKEKATLCTMFGSNWPNAPRDEVKNVKSHSLLFKVCPLIIPNFSLMFDLESRWMYMHVYKSSRLLFSERMADGIPARASTASKINMTNTHKHLMSSYFLIIQRYPSNTDI